MQTATPDLSKLLTLPLPLLAVGFFVCIANIARRRAKVGAPIAAARPGRAAKLALLGGYLVLLAALLYQRDLSPLPVVIVLGLSTMIVALTPGFHDAICGEEGVQRGWHARRFEELEEWRLIGDHLRFRLFGEWTSVPLPAAEHPRVRDKLMSLAAERESRFND